MIAAVATTDSAELVRFEIPGKPRNWSNGSHEHWANKARQKRPWKDASILLSQQARVRAGLPLATKESGVVRRLEVILHSARFYDDDGAYSAVKPIIDGLKGILIVDDKPAFCRIKVRQEKVPHYKEQRVEIIVREPQIEASPP